MKSAPARVVLPPVVAGLVLSGVAALPWLTGASPRLRAQAASPQSREMSLDFLALNADGTPITDLKAADLTLRVGGRPRTIKDLKLVSFGAAAPAAAAPAAAAPSGPPPPFGTNVGAAPGGGGDSGSRSYLFLVDTDSILPNVVNRLRDSIDKVVATLTPRDRVGLVSVPRPTLNVPLTTNHAAFRTSLGQLASTGAGSGSSAVCRTRDVLDMLKNVVSALNPADGPYNVVLLADNLSATGSGGGCEVTTSEYQRVPSVLATARARLYVVQAKETVGERNEGLEQLTGVSNAGAVIRLAGSETPLARVSRETATHYVVTFEVEPAERTGQLSRVELRTARQGATIRATNEIAMSKADATAAPSAGGAPDLPGMLKSSASFTALPLRGAAFFPTRTEGTGVRILALLEAVEPGTKFSGAGAGLIDEKNTIVTNAKANEKQLAAGAIIVPLDAPGPGTYRVRFVATDEKGRSGSVEHTIDTKFAEVGPLKFSGIFLGAPGTAGCAPKMVYSTEESLCALVEMYGQPTAQMSATLEIVPAAGGKPVASSGMAGSQTSQPDRFNLSVAAVPIASLPPGDYIVRANIGMQGHPDAVVSRMMRKVGK
jgi:hypothetical protein